MPTRARIWAGIILFICLGVSGILFYQIRDPILPPVVELTFMGDRNRTESFTILGTGGVVVIEKHDLTPETLRRDALCNVGRWHERTETIQLVCWWQDEIQQWWRANLALSLPKGDVSDWKFDHATLTLIPIAQRWLTINFWPLVFIVACGLCAFCAFEVAFNLVKKEPYLQT